MTTRYVRELDALRQVYAEALSVNIDEIIQVVE